MQFAALRKAGIPFDLAWQMIEGGATESEILAYIIAYGMTEGGKFNWSSFEWDRD